MSDLVRDSLNDIAAAAVRYGKPKPDRRRSPRLLRAPLRSSFELGKEREQIATQPTSIAAGDPNGARPIERLGDGIRRRNQL